MYISRSFSLLVLPLQPYKLQNLEFCISFLGLDGQVRIGTGHFTLCRSYDASHVAVLILDETEPQPSAAVCLVDITDIEFRSPGTSENGLVPPVPLTDIGELPPEAVRRSAPLPESYLWASAMRVMSQRGVCSIYSWRARRLLTLDMEAGDDEMEDAD